MRVGHIELPVADPVASGRFYVDVLGFELVANQADTFVWVQGGGVELLLKPGTAAAGPFAAMPSITLYSGALASDVERLRAAGLDLVVDRGCHHFQDPDGHWFQLVDPSDHA